MTDQSERTAANVQAHLLRAAKSPAGVDGRGYRTRNWSLFFFFRIMDRAELHETVERIRSLLQAPADPDPLHKVEFVRESHISPAAKMKMDLAFPAALNGGLVSQAKADLKDATAAPQAAAEAQAAASLSAESAAVQGRATSAPGAPAQSFLDWLKLLVRGDGAPLLDGARQLREALASAGEPDAALLATLDREGGAGIIDGITSSFAATFQAGNLAPMAAMAGELPAILERVRDAYRNIMPELRDSIDSADARFPHGPLARMVLYELLRQAGPMFADEVLPVLRPEAAEGERLGKPEPLDRTPITIAFSFAGLRKLGVDRTTLASFPDAFKEGMAARADRLGDVGASAPENWEGELGLSSVHGYFTGGSNVEVERHFPEAFWKTLRDEIRLFNDPTVDEGSDLRAWIGLLFRLIGLEVLHIELGQDPYLVDAEGNVVPLPERKEHFGFRDGISQPFVDLGLDDTPPGGGTADRRGTWSPLAPGEIFLDREDESGQKHLLPFNEDLRRGSTYVVFRKLEQDVEGFHSFLEQQRPDAGSRKRLAAQFFGRWPNGTSLVRSPATERSTAGAESEATLNDFRYAEEDPSGRKCPLGAHVRRSNPRDIGGRNDVRHHRILRRGMAFGGRLLGPGEVSDGEPRGILFMAVNARIDLQFEVVQGDWLNRGEFLGQAGLDRCPITGANNKGTASRFVEAGAVAPVTGLPSFVTLRGGDYFFAPGIAALEGLADGRAFEPSELPYHGCTMNDAETPSLFSAERLARYWSGPLRAGKPVRVNAGVLELPSGARMPETVAYVGWYSQVKTVLSNDPVKGGTGGVNFSVEPYLTAGRRITRGEDFLIGLDSTDTSGRQRLFACLNAAWNRLGPEASARVGAVAKEALDAALRRVGAARRLDLVEDLAAQAAYRVIKRIFGIAGPSWLTELAAALPFSRQHVGDLPRDWIAAARGEAPSDQGLKTMQVWTIFLVADLIGNTQSERPLQAVARQAGSEMMNHIDQTLALAREVGLSGKPRTLIEAFLYNASLLGAEMQHLKPPEPSGLLGDYGGLQGGWLTQYARDVSILLLETLGSTLAVIPLTFGSVMSKLLELRIDLPVLLPRLGKDGAAHIIYEAERLNPNSATRVRRCAAAMPAGDRLSPIQPGDFVAALISKANMDRHVFWRPERFSLGQNDPMADTLFPHADSESTDPRDPDNYLLFGVKGSHKDCWGRDRVAMPVLVECIHACGRLQGLRRVAGSRGEPQRIGPVIVGLPARFARVGKEAQPPAPDPAVAPGQAEIP